MFPYCDAAIPVGIDVAIRLARNATAYLEHLGLKARITDWQLYADVEGGNRAARSRDDVLLKDEIAALDMDGVAVIPSVHLRLVKGDRRLDLVERQQVFRPS
jgi:hypothetical protein